MFAEVSQNEIRQDFREVTATYRASSHPFGVHSLLGGAMEDAPQLRHGSDWAEHEDCIVGNEAGLQRLRDACDTALREGQYFGKDLGEFVGVKKLESKWFESPTDAKSTTIASMGFGVILLVLLALVLVGIGTVFQWVLAS